MSYASDVSSTNRIKVGALETDDPESSDYIQRDINVLSYASKAAFIDIARDGKEGTLENDAPGDIALTVRIDYLELLLRPSSRARRL